MTYSLETPKKKYLPSMRFHQAPIIGLSPDDIKSAAKQMLKVRYLRDREEISLKTTQNFICKSLGFTGGFAGYRDEYSEQLLPFMESESLTILANLIDSLLVDNIVRFTHRQIADRLFNNDGVMPTRIFTGQGVRAIDLLRFAWESENHKVVCQFTGIETKPHELIPENGLAISNPEGTLNYGDVTYFRNMLGDQFLDFADASRNIKVVPEVYFENMNEGRVAEEERLVRAGQILRSLVLELDDGWVDVVPYNENLVFLRCKDGRYDFVFRGMRDTPFEHNPYMPYLRNEDVPKTRNRYDFWRWLYFPSCGEGDQRPPYKGWLEKDTHEAEKMFYAVGGTQRGNPGGEILRDYLIGKEAYKPPLETSAWTKGFHPCQINGEEYYVSNLISQAQFAGFMEENSEYREYSRKECRVDEWRTVNCDDDGSLPASVTWYDAMAYTAWISKTFSLPVRLPTEEEYRSIATQLIPVDDKERYFENYVDRQAAPKKAVENLKASFSTSLKQRLCRFERTDGSVYPGHPPYMQDEEFKKLLFKYNIDALSWKESENGLRFLNSPYFGEWLGSRGVVIGTFLLCSLYSHPACMVSAMREGFAATSTGKYKSWKIGFRLIYKATV